MIIDYAYLQDENGDTVIQNVPKGSKFSSRIEVVDTDGTTHQINYIEFPDKSWWWQCDGSDLIWGPSARLGHAIFSATDGTRYLLRNSLNPFPKGCTK